MFVSLLYLYLASDNLHCVVYDDGDDDGDDDDGDDDSNGSGNDSW